MDPKAIFEDILKIIHFKDDPDLFIKTFFDACQKKAVYESIKDDQEFNPQIYAKHLTEITEKALRKYIASITPSLTPQEKTDLQEYFRKSS